MLDLEQLGAMGGDGDFLAAFINSCSNPHREENVPDGGFDHEMLKTQETQQWLTGDGPVP